MPFLTRLPKVAAGLGLVIGGLVGGAIPAAAQSGTASITASATVLPPVQSRVLQNALRRVNQPMVDGRDVAMAYADLRDGAQVSVSTDGTFAAGSQVPARLITISFTGI